MRSTKRQICRSLASRARFAAQSFGMGQDALISAVLEDFLSSPRDLQCALLSRHFDSMRVGLEASQLLATLLPFPCEGEATPVVKSSPLPLTHRPEDGRDGHRP